MFSFDLQGPQLLNDFGNMHGGAVASIFDEATSWAIFAYTRKECPSVTVSSTSILSLVFPLFVIRNRVLWNLIDSSVLLILHVPLI